MRPRIRSLKPECWTDDALGQVSLQARLLFVGLITQADDAGRLRAAAPLLRSQIFPYDHSLPLKHIDRWLEELADGGLVVVYESEGRRYATLNGWEKHQKVDHAKDSELPSPPRKGSSRKRAKPREDSRENAKDSETVARDRSPRTRPRIGSDLGSDQGSGDDAPNGASRRAGEELPGELAAYVEPVRSVLLRVAEAKQGAQEPTEAAIALALKRFPGRDFMPLAQDFEHWWLHGNGERKQLKDVVRGYRNWIEKEPDVLRKAPPEAAVPAAELSTPAFVERINARGQA